MVVPLPDLRHLGVEAAQVFVHQVVAVVAPVFVEGLGHFALGLGGEVAPDAPVFHGQLRRHRAVGVDGVAAVDKEVRQAQAHCLVDAHAADIRVDAEALPYRVAAPDKTDVPALRRRTAQMAEPGLAGRAGLGILEGHPIEDRLVGRQPGQLHPRREVGAGIGQGRNRAPGVAEHASRVPLHHHPRRTIAAAPDHRLIPQQIPGLHPVGELRPILDRSDHRRRQARHQQPRPGDLHDPTTAEVELAHGDSLTMVKKHTLDSGDEGGVTRS